MRPTTSFLLRALAALAAGLALMTAQASAQQLQQVQLSDKQVEGFINAQPDFAPLAAKLREGGEKLPPEVLAQLEEIAKKHGFKDFAEFENVGSNITLVLDGLDKTGQYADPVIKMKAEREQIVADTTIPEADKKLALDDLDQEIAAAQPLQFQSNVDVVKKHREAIDKLVPAQTDEPTDGAAPEGADPQGSEEGASDPQANPENK